MELRCQMPVYINMTLCDNTSRLGIANTFGLFLDLATVHAEKLGIGVGLMQKEGLFWVTARTHVHFYHRPHMTETVTAETFLGQARGPKAVRYYRIFSGNETLVEGKTDFVAVNAKTGAFMRAEPYYPSEEEAPKKADGTRDTACEDLPAFATAAIDPDFTGAETFGAYTVRSVDIDLGSHMDNVAYVYALMGLFSCSDLKKYAFNDVDIVYRKPCYEGQTLTASRRILKLEDAGGMEVAFTLPDGTQTTLMRLLSF